MDNNNTLQVREEESTTPRNISMYPTQWAVVEEINNRFDFRNLSIAMRFLINDYARMKGQYSADQPQLEQ